MDISRRELLTYTAALPIATLASPLLGAAAKAAVATHLYGATKLQWRVVSITSNALTLLTDKDTVNDDPGNSSQTDTNSGDIEQDRTR